MNIKTKNKLNFEKNEIKINWTMNNLGESIELKKQISSILVQLNFEWILKIEQKFKCNCCVIL